MNQRLLVQCSSPRTGGGESLQPGCTALRTFDLALQQLWSDDLPDNTAVRIQTRDLLYKSLQPWLLPIEILCIEYKSINI